MCDIMVMVDGVYMKNKTGLELITLVLIFIVMFFLIINVPIIVRYKNTSDLIINEVLSSNKNTTESIDGNKYDFIELYNGYDYDIDLFGYYLSDDNFNLKKWSFPDVTIKAKSYLIIYASGLDKYENGEIHTNFKLSNKGEVLSLSDDNAKVLSRIFFNETLPDTSYGYNGYDYVYFYVPTPNLENSKEYSKKPIINIDNSNIRLKISKYIINDNSSIEIYNEEDYDIDIENFYISDSLKNRYKYKFPSVIIKSKESMTIYASGLDKYEDGKIHTNFVLSNNDSEIILSDNNKQEITKVKIQNSENNIVKDVRINEVSSIDIEAIELKNLTDSDINLSNYKIGDKNKLVDLSNIIIKANSYIVLYGSDNNYYDNGKLYTGFHINNSTEKIYLYKDDLIIDEFSVGRLINNVSTGINDQGDKVYYNKVTLGSNNSSDYFEGYCNTVVFSKNGGYIDSGTKIELSSNDNCSIYYTLDGSFPTNNSSKYIKPIEINKTTTLKVVAYNDKCLPSEIISRTFFVGRRHDLPIISLSTDNNNLFGSHGIISNYHQDVNKIISFEIYEKNGNLGVNFIGDTKLSGMDSREQPQKSMSIYLRKKYGLKEVTYPFFKESNTNTYSSLLLRNAGEDPKNIRIMDAVLTKTLKDNMDIDMQDYQPVVVYINGNYFGIYNLREKLNEDYLVSKYNIEKGSIDLIKYNEAVKGSKNDYEELIKYIENHDTTDKEVYEYLKSQIDIQELINYVIVQTYYGNTDLGNIRYWKSKENGKWRWMLYDLDWSMWNSDLELGYPVIGGRVPAVTYLNSLFTITRNLYKNQEFKDLYLTTFSYHLKNTFKPDRMNKIVDELVSEIESEMPYHIKRWGSEYNSLNSMDKWKKNLSSFKTMINSRYNKVLKRLKTDFNLNDQEYNKYFGDV